MAEQFFVAADNEPNRYYLCDPGAKIRHNSEVAVRLFGKDGKAACGYMLATVTTKRVHPRRRIYVQFVRWESGLWVGLLKPHVYEVIPIVGRYEIVDI